MPDRSVAVRHFPSTRFVEGQRVHVFVFDPAEDRSLDARIRLARAQVARERGCRWIGGPDAMIASETARQGRLYAGQVLAAPLDCEA